MAPMMVMTSATTAAKIGRSMKKRLMFIQCPVPLAGSLGATAFIPAPSQASALAGSVDDTVMATRASA